MVAPPDEINLESFKSKVYLLILDKVVLGALIAIALFAYDRWKVFDQRAYDDHVTFAFQRAGYVKDLVPIVLSKQNVAVRSEALIALIRTRSIADASAISMANRLLDDGLIRAESGELFRQIGTDPLLDALLEHMPAALPSMLEGYELRKSAIAQRGTETGDAALNEADTDRFWGWLLYRTIQDKPDRDLSQFGHLDDDTFLSTYLPTLVRVYNNSPTWMRWEPGYNWRIRRPKAVRILAALADNGDSIPNRAQIAQSEASLLGVLDPSAPTEANLELASTLLDLIRSRELASPALLTRCVEIVSGRLRYPHQWMEDDRGGNCLHYIGWYATDADNEYGDAVSSDYISSSKPWLDVQRLVDGEIIACEIIAIHEPIGSANFQRCAFGQRVSDFVKILFLGTERHRTQTTATTKALDDLFHLDEARIGRLSLRGQAAAWPAIRHISQLHP